MIINNTGKNKIDSEIHKKAEINKQNKHIGSVSMQRGHTMFEVNTITGEITKAKLEKVAVSFSSHEHIKSGNIAYKSQIIVNDDCIYISALNIKNVVKKINKFLK